MPAKIITLSQKDQDLLRVALTRAIGEEIRWVNPHEETDLIGRIKDLKDRLLV
jgi:hypothetical protein